MSDSGSHSLFLRRVGGFLLQLLIADRLQPSLVAVVAAYGWSLLLHAPWSWRELLLVALTTASAYQLNRLSDPEDGINSPNEWSSARRQRRRILAVSLGASASALVLASTSEHPSPTLLLVAFCLGLGFLYSNPCARGRYRLKRVLVFKEALPAVGWTLVSIGIPAVGCTLCPTHRVLLASFYNAAQVAVIEIIWNLRDVAGDAALGVRSLPVTFGDVRSIRFGHTMNLAAAVGVAAGYGLGIIDSLWLCLGAVNSLHMAVWLALARRYATRRPFSHILQAAEAVFLLGAALLAEAYYG